MRKVFKGVTSLASFIGTNIALENVMVTRLVSLSIDSKVKKKLKKKILNPSAVGHTVEVKVKCLWIRSDGGIE